jgi:hypothetical protein
MKKALLTSTLLLALLPCLHVQSAEMRVWTNQQGRTVKAAFVEMRGTMVVLLLENGTQTQVPMGTLAGSDQIYLQTMHGAAEPGKPGVTPAVALTWPSAVTVDPKSLVIVQGEQDEAGRNYHYQCGPFEFIAKAPLAGTVMKEVGADFELTRSVFAALPWGWHPKPPQGPFFKIYLTETDEDFILLGGIEGSAAGSQDDYAFVKFSAIGLKKVGAKYAYDARQRVEGQVVGMTTRLLIGDMRNLLQPWAALGMEKLLRTVAYHNGSISFTGLASRLKAEVKNDLASGAKLDLKGLVEMVRSPWSEQRNNARQLRVQNYLNSVLLVYYFGFLEGQGAGLHQYFRDVSEEAMAWREYRETGGKSGRPQYRGKTSEEIALIFLDKLLAGRDDVKLAADLAAGFGGMGIKFEK